MLVLGSERAEAGKRGRDAALLQIFDRAIEGDVDGGRGEGAPPEKVGGARSRLRVVSRAGFISSHFVAWV